MIKSSNSGSYTNPFQHLTIDKLKSVEDMFAANADWFQKEVAKFEKDAQILDSPDCDIETAEQIKNKASWLETRRKFELTQIDEYNKVKKKLLMANFYSGTLNI